MEWKYNVFDLLINISWGKVSKFQLEIYKSTYAKLCALKIKKNEKKNTENSTFYFHRYVLCGIIHVRLMYYLDVLYILP